MGLSEVTSHRKRRRQLDPLAHTMAETGTPASAEDPPVLPIWAECREPYVQNQDVPRWYPPLVCKRRFGAVKHTGQVYVDGPLPFH